MRNTQKILSVLLVLVLVSSSMALSGHDSSHIVTDSGLCPLCIHPGESTSVITPESDVFFVIASTLASFKDCESSLSLPAILHSHQSRAPPYVT